MANAILDGRNICCGLTENTNMLVPIPATVANIGQYWNGSAFVASPYEWTGNVLNDLNNTPAQNTAAIQAAADIGPVKISAAPGAVIYINDTIYADVLELEHGVTLLMAAGTGKPLLRNSALKPSNPTYNISSLTCDSAGTVSAVTTAPHPFVAGQFVAIEFAMPDHYTGVYQIDTVADTTHFTYKAISIPNNLTASVFKYGDGTTYGLDNLRGGGNVTSIRCRAANKACYYNINGTLDYDHANNNTGQAGIDRMAVQLAFINNLYGNFANITNALKYALHVSTIANPQIFVHSDGTNSDLFHFSGGIYGGEARVSGKAGDNIIGGGPMEGMGAATGGTYKSYEINPGSIVNFKLKNIDARHSGTPSSVRLWGEDPEGPQTGNWSASVELEDVRSCGSSATEYPVQVFGGRFRHLLIKKPRGHMPTDGVVVKVTSVNTTGCTTTIDNLIIDAPHLESTGNKLLEVSGYSGILATVKNLVVNAPSIESPALTKGLVQLGANSVIDKLSFNEIGRAHV